SEETEESGAEEPFDASGSPHEDDLDGLIAAAAAGGDDATSEVLETNDPLSDLMEDELKTIVAEDADSLLASGDGLEALNAEDMEDRLDGGSEDELTTEIVLDTTDQAIVESVGEDAASGDESSEVATSSEEPVNEELLQEVGVENVVAGADHEEATEDAVDEPVEEAAVESEAVSAEGDSESEDTSELEPKWGDDFPAIPAAAVQLVREQPLRSVTAAAAGIIMALSAFLVLSTFEFRPVSYYTSIVLDDDSHLRRAIATAELLIESEDYIEATFVMEKALSESETTSPLYQEGQYVQLEAEIKGLGDTASLATANRLHSDIDFLVDTAPLHAKRNEALFWKSNLYEKEGNLLAARVELRELLKTEQKPVFHPQILLAAGTLELKTDRALTAAQYLQQLRREYPGTVEASRGRLILGDALVASGDLEGARVKYIAVAQDNVTNEIGAEAFSRLGQLAFDSGEYEQAIRGLEDRLSNASTVEGNDGVTLLLAKAYRATGRLDEAKNVLQGLIDFFPESDVMPLAQVEMSQVLAELGSTHEAVRYGTRTVQAYPDNPAVLRNAGELLALYGDALEAGRALLAAHWAGANDPELMLSAGRLFAESGATIEARNTFYQLSERYPKTRQGLLGNVALSRLLFDEGEVSEAIQRLEGVVYAANSSSRKLPALNALGELYTRMNLMTKAAEAYSEAAILSSEPEVLAVSAIHLFESGATDDALVVAAGIEVQQLDAPIAYAFLNALGMGTMRRDLREGLAYLKQAHLGYPEHRTSEGVQTLLEAYLTLNRPQGARDIVSELARRLEQREFAMERPRLEKAAITWGNFLFNREDYRGAVTAYELALESQVLNIDEDAPPLALSERQLWSMFQLANAQYQLADYEASIVLYNRVADSSSPWSSEAETKVSSARLEQRLRGEPVPEAQNAG
ncbi:MAG: tetratricopeptide repeat protein, partial [Candidatus Hydrogenedentota bacterium]